MTEDIKNEPLIDEVTEIIKQLARNCGDAVTSQSDILVEMDFDSLQLLELTTIIKEQYGVDFFEQPNGLRELKNAETIVAVLQREKAITALR